MIQFTHAYITIILFSIGMPLFFFRGIGVLGCLLWTYGLLSAAWPGYSPFYAPEYLHPIFQARVQDLALQSFGFMAIIPPVILILADAYPRHLITFLRAMLVLDSFAVLHWGCGMFNVGSMDAGVIAAGLPMFLMEDVNKKILWVGFCICAIAILASTSATGAIVALIALTAFYSRKKLLYGVIAGLSIFGVSFAIQGHELFNLSGRVAGWQSYMDWWAREAPHLTGPGISTFEGIAPYLLNKGQEIFLYMHNDWLQILFDGGIIGFVLALAFTIQILYKARHSPALFACILGFMACMAPYAPLHFGFGQIFACSLIGFTVSLWRAEKLN